MSVLHSLELTHDIGLDSYCKYQLRFFSKHEPKNMCCLVEIQLVGLSYMSTVLKLLNHCLFILFTTFSLLSILVFHLFCYISVSFFSRLDIWLITVQLSIKYSIDANIAGLII